MTRNEAPPRMRLALALALAALLAGCAKPASTPAADAAPPTGPTAPDAATLAREEARARAALDAALAALHAPEGLFAALPGVGGFDATVRSASPMGAWASSDLSMRYGLGDSSRLTTTTDGRKATVTCGAEGYVATLGDLAELARRVPNVTCAGGGAAILGDPPREGAGLSYAGTERARTVPGADVTARFVVPGGGTIAVTIDAGDKLLALDVGDARSSASYRIVYAERAEIPLPAWTTRSPARVVLDEGFRPGEVLLTVRFTQERPPRSEIAMRIANATGVPEASFALALDGEQAAEKFKLVYEDRDADGRVSQGDAISISSPYWIERADFDATMFDAWANATVRR